MLWTGGAIVAINSQGLMSGNGFDVRPGDTSVWNPATKAWTQAARAPLALGETPAVWTGRAVLALARNGRLMSFQPR